MGKHWYTMQARDDNGERVVDLSIMDEIGYWGITAADFINDLQAAGNVDVIKMDILSPGGSVFEGNAIYNALQMHRARVDVTVHFAASMASVIAMAGDEAPMIAENGYLMIHNPFSYVVGEADDMRRAANLLDSIKQNIVRAYQKHADLSDDEVGQMMDDETYIDAEKAVELGFAREIGPTIQAAASITGRGLDLQKAPDGALAFILPPADGGDNSEGEGDEDDDSNDTAGNGPEGNDGAGPDGSGGEGSEAAPGDGPGSGGGHDGTQTPEAFADLTARLQASEATVARLTEEVSTLTGAVNEWKQNTETVKAELATEKAKVDQLTGGFGYEPETPGGGSASTGKQEHPYMRAVHALVDEGMEYGAALNKVHDENPALYAQFLKDNEIKKD